MPFRYTSSPLGTRNAIAKNLVSDFGGTDDTAFSAFRTWAIANQGTRQIVLTIDSGSACTLTNFANLEPFAGIKDLVVSGYGASLNVNITSGSCRFGAHGVVADNAHHANVVTVSSGASSVTLVTPAQASLFSVDQWVMLSGHDLQGSGQPPNPAFFEYLKIQSINSGVITFYSPLQYSYKSTWPLFYAGSGGEPYHAGPATLYSLGTNWDTRVDVRGLAITGAGQTSCAGRDIILRDCTFSDTHGPIPSEARSVQFIGIIGSVAVLEADKLVETWTLQNCSFQGINFQSTSIHSTTMTGCTITDTVSGTPYDFTMVNCTIANLGGGSTSYGWSNSITQTNTAVGAYTPRGSEQTSVDSDFTMSGGIMTRPIASGAVSWAQPNGTYNFVKGVTLYPFTITDISESGGNVRITTNLAGGFPDTGLKAKAIVPTRVIT